MNSRLSQVQVQFQEHWQRCQVGSDQRPSASAGTKHNNYGAMSMLTLCCREASGVLK